MPRTKRPVSHNIRQQLNISSFDENTCFCEATVLKTSLHYCIDVNSKKSNSSSQWPFPGCGKRHTNRNKHAIHDCWWSVTCPQTIPDSSANKHWRNKLKCAWHVFVVQQRGNTLSQDLRILCVQPHTHEISGSWIRGSDTIFEGLIAVISASCLKCSNSRQAFKKIWYNNGLPKSVVLKHLWSWPDKSIINHTQRRNHTT